MVKSFRLYNHTTPCIHACEMIRLQSKHAWLSYIRGGYMVQIYTHKQMYIYASVGYIIRSQSKFSVVKILKYEKPIMLCGAVMQHYTFIQWIDWSCKHVPIMIAVLACSRCVQLINIKAFFCVKNFVFTDLICFNFKIRYKI